MLQGSISTGSIEINIGNAYKVTVSDVMYLLSYLYMCHSYSQSSSDDESFHTPGSESPGPQLDDTQETSTFSPVTSAERTRRISLGEPIHPPKGELLTLAKPGKPVHPAISTIKDGNVFTQHDRLGWPYN